MTTSETGTGSEGTDIPTDTEEPPPTGESLSPGCNTTPPADEATIDVDGSSATYILDLPANYDNTRPYPLVFAFHGAGVAPEMFKTYFNISSQVGADGIVITPNALGNASAWDSNRDLPLFDALVEKLTQRYCVDMNRIFAAGHSSGGFFTHTVGCSRSDVVRGIAPASAGPPRGNCGGEVATWISQGISDEAVSVDSVVPRATIGRTRMAAT